MRIPGPQGPGQAPEHAPPQESLAGVQRARLPGQFVAASRAQVENQILPDRLHLRQAAAVIAQVSDVCHWAPARKNGPRAQAVRQKTPDLSRSRDLSRLRLPGSGATPQRYAAAASEDRGAGTDQHPVPGDAARSKRSHALGCPGRLLDADQVTAATASTKTAATRRITSPGCRYRAGARTRPHGRVPGSPAASSPEPANPCGPRNLSWSASARMRNQPHGWMNP
jgi:hypothetical protein